jgi:hypothetical protein
MISRRGVVCVFFFKDMDDDDFLSGGCYVDGARFRFCPFDHPPSEIAQPSARQQHPET